MHEDLISDLETDFLFENESLYVLSKKKDYPGFTKCKIKDYTSFDAERISPEDLEKIIFEYLNF